MTLLDAGFIDGTVVNGAMLRRAFAAAGVVGGLADPTALKVSPLTVPSSAVAVAPGSASVLSPFATAGTEVYTITNDQTEVVQVPGNNTNGSLTRELFIRVHDPAFAGELSHPPTFEVASNRPVGKPHLWLATITLPAGTSTILADHITPRAKVLSPRRDRNVSLFLPAGTANMPSSWASWPAWSNPVAVPEWAHKLRAVATISGVEYARPASGQTTSNGYVILHFAGNNAQGLYTGRVRASEHQTLSITVVGEFDVPGGIRGTTQQLNLQAMKVSGDGTYRVNEFTTIAVDYEFTEE